MARERSKSQLVEAIAKKQRSFKNILIDKEYQLRYTLYSLLICGLLCGGLGGVIIWQTRADTRLIEDQRTKATALFQKQLSAANKQFAAERAHTAAEIKKLNRVATDMVKLQMNDPEPEVVKMAKAALADLKKGDAERQRRRQATDKLLVAQRKQAAASLVAHRKKQDKQAVAQRSTREWILIGAVIGFGFLFLIILTVFNIVITHKVAGPLYKMGMYLDQIRDGKLGKLRDLRKGDKLVSFFERFKAMHTALKDQTEEDIKAIEAALGVLEKKGVSGSELDELKSRLEAKRQSIAMN